MVRRPTSLLAPIGLAPALLAATIYYGVAHSLPSLGRGDVALFAMTGLGVIVFGVLVLLVTSLRDAGSWLVPLALLEGLVAVALTGEGFLEIATTFKIVAAASFGLFLARYVPNPPLAYLLAAVVLIIDIASVAAGPTKELIEHHPQATSYLSLLIPQWGTKAGGIEVGVSDVAFMAGFMSFVWRFGLRVRSTAVLLVASLAGSLAMSVFAARAVPALPLLSIALIAPNIDIITRQLCAGVKGKSKG